MEKKEENSLTKSILEFVPLITFFLAYYYFPNSNNLMGEDLSVEKIIFATKIFVPVLLMASALSYLILRTLSKMSLITALLVIFFGIVIFSSGKLEVLVLILLYRIEKPGLIDPPR